MADNSFNEVVNSLLTGMDKALTSKTVVGDAIKVGDTIILPLVDVSFGVGAGSNTGDKKNIGCGGLGGKMTPSAVLIIQKGHTKLVNVKNQDSLTKLIDMIPELVDRFSKSKDVNDEQAVDIAFPEKDKKAEN